MRLPNLIIPGAPKCGTTSLAEYLSTSDSIFLPFLKEPNYWSADMPHFARREGLETLSHYRALYEKAPNSAEYLVDASTHYLYSDSALRDIERAIVTPKYICCVRPQEEIAVAWHMQMVNAGYEDLLDFEAAWRAITARRKGALLPLSCPEPKLLDYERLACVGGQIARLLSHVDSDRVLVVSLARLRDDPRGVIRDLSSFLDVEFCEANNLPKSNSAFVNRSRVLGRWARSPKVRPYVNRVMARLPPQIAKRVKNQIKAGLYRPQSRSALGNLMFDELSAKFREDKELLEQILRTQHFGLRQDESG